jgi:hypothetical protein
VRSDGHHQPLLLNDCESLNHVNRPILSFYFNDFCTSMILNYLSDSFFLYVNRPNESWRTAEYVMATVYDKLFILVLNIVRSNATRIVLVQFLWTVGATGRILNFIQILRKGM